MLLIYNEDSLGILAVYQYGTTLIKEMKLVCIILANGAFKSSTLR